MNMKSSTARAAERTYQGTAGAFYAGMGVGWNLGNALDCLLKAPSANKEASSDAETAWGNPVITPELIQMVKDAGFGSIRVPVTWTAHMGPAPDYPVNRAWMNRVREVVDMVLDAGLYCIINVHHDTGTGGWLHASDQSVREDSARFEALWRQIAGEFRADDDHLVFEGFNEMLDERNNWVYPRTTSAKNAINHFNQLFVDTVRASGGRNATRCLIVNAYGATNDISALEDFVMPTDSAEHALVFGFHYYSPISYCFDRSGSENTQTVWTENGGREALITALRGVSELFTGKGIPAILGEFAAAHKGNEADRAEWARFMVETCAESGVKCIWWDNGGKVRSAASYSTMGLLDRYKLEWLFPQVVEALTGVAVTEGQRQMSLHLETPRLSITCLQEIMAPEIQRQSQDAQTRRYLPDEVFDTPEEALEAVRELMDAYRSPDGPYVYAVVRRDGALVGYVELCRIDEGWEVGYHIGAEYTGQGYATESVRAFLPAMMEKLSIDRVWGVVDERNAASCRVLEKCGFKLVESGEGIYHGMMRSRRRYILERMK